MNRRIALTGDIFSGKTALAEKLRDEHGFYLANFTDLLKDFASDAFQACNRYIPAWEIKNNKVKYRVFLQELAVLIGWNECPEDYISESLSLCKWWPLNSDMPCVFDNVRSPVQAECLIAEWDFSIVRLELDEYTQLCRAGDEGVSWEKLVKMRKHAIEQPIPDRFISLTLDATKSLDCLVSELVNFSEGIL